MEERDALATAIGQVEGELDAALEGLDGWAGGCAELRGAAAGGIAFGVAAAGGADSAAWIGCWPSRRRMTIRWPRRRPMSGRRGIAKRCGGRIFGSWRRCGSSCMAILIGTLAWVRELVTMIHLAKFSGAPAARAEELVAQIAAAVQGLSEVSAWREEEVGV